MSSFPIIDISSLTQKYLDGESYLKDISADPITKDISKKIVNAFSEYGFIYIKGHNIPESTISSMFKTSEHFFKHESDLKNQFIRTTNDNWGYVPFRLETFEKSRPFDLKECFNFFLRPSPNEQLNIVSPSLVSESTNLFHVCKKLGHLLLKAINLGLNTDDKSNFLYNHHNDIGNYSNNPTTLRLLYYPSIEDESFVQDRQLRCGEHSDYGTITLLFQDEAGGLQVGCFFVYCIIVLNFISFFNLCSEFIFLRTMIYFAALNIEILLLFFFFKIYTLNELMRKLYKSELV